MATLTLPYACHNPRALQQKMNSYLNWVRKATHNRYLRVLDINVHGLHYHLLLVVDFDVMSGTDIWLLEHMKHDTNEKRLNCCNPALQEFWREAEIEARGRGFGRFDLAPTYKNADSVASYLTKPYATAWPTDASAPFKRARIWTCSKALRCTTARFCMVRPGGGSRYRDAVYAYVAELGYDNLEEAVEASSGNFFREVVIWQRAREARSNSDREGTDLIRRG